MEVADGLLVPIKADAGKLGRVENGGVGHYRVRARFGDRTVEVEDPYRFPPILTEFDLYLLGEGNLYALALTPTALYVTCNGDDTKGWVAKADLNGTKFGKLERWLPTKEMVEVDAPVGIAISKQGDIVVGQFGENNKPNDSLLTFYSAKTGKMLMNLETKLYDITGLAYSPKTGLLYATDFAWMKTDEGGLFRLDASGNSVKTTKIASLDKPTALAFAPDGTLYITVIGPKAEGENASKQGKLLKIAPGL